MAVPATPLLIGGVIYLLWRSTSLLMFCWFDFLGLHSVIDAIRTATAPMRGYMPSWMLYSLADAAWASCGVFLFAALWSDSGHPSRHFWVLLAPTLTIGGEFAQFFHLIPGTFDIADVISCTLACAVSVLLANRLFAYGTRSDQAQSV
jgi:hypothetical protein